MAMTFIVQGFVKPLPEKLIQLVLVVLVTGVVQVVDVRHEVWHFALSIEDRDETVCTALWVGWREGGR